jgi:DNA polymerase-3 subunit delta
VAPAYLLLGEEVLLREEFLSRLLEALLPPGMEALNRETVLAEEVDAPHVVAHCRSVPAFAPRRVLLIKEADRLRNEVWDPLLSYLEAPCPTTCLILTARKLDQRSRLFRSLQRLATVLRFTALGPGDLERWLQERAKRQGKLLTPEAQLLLLNLQGAELLRLAQEIDKLCLFVGERRRIEAADVVAVVGEARIREIFELTAQVGRRDMVGALTCLRRLLEAGDEPLQILGMLARQVRLLLKAKELLTESASPTEISRALGVPMPFLPELLEEAKASPSAQFERGLARLLKLDRDLKSRGKGQPLHFELALIDLCS